MEIQNFSGGHPKDPPDPTKRSFLTIVLAGLTGATAVASVPAWLTIRDGRNISRLANRSNLGSIDALVAEQDAAEMLATIRESGEILKKEAPIMEYDKAYKKLQGVVIRASKRSLATSNMVYYAVETSASEYAALAAFLTGSPRRMEEALRIYRNLIISRQAITEKFPKLERLHTKEYQGHPTDSLSIISQQAIREKMAKVISHLYSHKSGKEREELRQEGINLYLDLWKTGNDEQRKEYTSGFTRLEYAHPKNPLGPNQRYNPKLIA